MAFVNRCIFLPTAGGTSTWTVSSAKTGYLTPAQAGAVDATTYRYTAELRDGSGTITAWEVGTTVYTSASTTLTRTVLLSSNANTVVNFASPPDIMLCILGEDLFAPAINDGAPLGSASLSFSDLYLASGGTINWANSNVIITHATNTLAFSSSDGFAFNTTGTTTTGVSGLSSSLTRPSSGIAAGGIWQTLTLSFTDNGTNASLSNQLIRMNYTFNGTADVSAFDTYIAAGALSINQNLTNFIAIALAGPAVASTKTLTIYTGLYLGAASGAGAVTSMYGIRSDAGSGIWDQGDTTASSSSITGALRVAGGAGINGAIYGGSTIYSKAATPILGSKTTITGGSTANVPTLTTGPVTGNPTKWLPYDDNGTTRHIPSW